jgi:hypothetical protein
MCLLQCASDVSANDVMRHYGKGWMFVQYLWNYFSSHLRGMRQIRVTPHAAPQQMPLD